MSEIPDPRRKRLLFRSWHRGTKEADLILGRFAERNLSSFSEDQLARYEALLERSDPEIYAWISGSEAVPPECDHDVMALLMDFKDQVSNT
jgi:antitoxin CptB